MRSRKSSSEQAFEFAGISLAQAYRWLPVVTILALMLAACSHATVTPTAEIQNTKEASPTAYEITATREITRTPTPDVIDTIPELVEAYINGEEDDLSGLTNEEREEFSIAYAEKLNEKPNIISYDGEKETGVGYLDPDTFTMLHIENGKNEQEKTFTRFYPVRVGEEGILEIRDNDRKWTTIKGSKGFDWTMVVTDYRDTRIDWPDIDKVNGSDLTKLEWIISDENDEPVEYVYKPIIIFPKKNIGSMWFEGIEGQPPRFETVFQGVSVETDKAGNPVSARAFILKPYLIRLYEEGTSVEIETSPTIYEVSEFYQKLEANKIYFAAIPTNQKYMVERQWITIQNWSGFVPLDESFCALNGDGSLENNDKTLLITVKFIIGKAE